MALIPIQALGEGGNNLTYASVASGDEIDLAVAAGKTVVLHVKNGGGGSINVTLTANSASFNTADSGLVSKANNVTAVGAGADRMICLKPSAIWKNVNNRIPITFSGVTSVTVAAFTV